MGTKNLARTLIEGGRHKDRYNRDTDKALRCATRAFLTRVRSDVEYAEDHTPGERLKLWQYRAHRGKTAPIRRWLDSHVGQP